jgi:membrane protease YdiL (CAAX protease family)
MAIIYFIRISKLRLKDFGVTLTGWRRSVTDALWVSVLFIAVLALIKYIVVQRSPGMFREKQIFDFGYFGITYITYLLVAPLQEFIGRGVVQGTLINILDIRHKGLIAILVTTFLFSALHMTHSLNLSIASFITGLILGWMYNRHKTLAGVSLAHFLIGNASGLMGYWTLM